jgi:hypothetical protein
MTDKICAIFRISVIRGGFPSNRKQEVFCRLLKNASKAVEQRFLRTACPGRTGQEDHRFVNAVPISPKNRGLPRLSAPEQARPDFPKTCQLMRRMRSGEVFIVRKSAVKTLKSQ